MRVGFAIPGPLDAVSGGYAYDRALIAEAPVCGVELAPIVLPEGYPFPDGFPPRADASAAARAEAALTAWPGPLLIDGLAYGALSERVARAVGPRAVALTHHPLAYETGLSPAAAAALRASERAALACAAGVIATSETTAQALVAEFGVPRDRIDVAPPGFARRPRAPLVGRPPVALAVGAVIRRKRLPELVRAFESLSDLDWRLRLIGPMAGDAAEQRALATAIARAGADRIALLGPVSEAELADAYLGADLFISAAAYEGYGMALAEATLHGLPLVAAAGGAAAATAASGALVDPALEGDALSHALAAAARPLLADPAARARAAERSWAARAEILTPGETARRACAALRRRFGAKPGGSQRDV